MRHASPTPVPFRIPAHYLSEATQGYPLILLADTASYGDAVVQSALPVGVGLMPRDPALMDGPCTDCGMTAAVWVQDPWGEDPGDLGCLGCLVATYGSSYGVVPAMAVEWVGVDG